jgi:signal peptidase I
MDSNFYTDEYILVNRISYIDFPFIWKLKEYKRWDVVIFDPQVTKNTRYLIKRIIWLPWEKLKIENWKVYIKKKNSQIFEELKEKYLNVFNKNNTKVSWSKETVIYNIPENSYFVMWDNRLHSTDSRECFRNCKIYDKHFVKEKEILWKVFIDLWYFNFSEFKFIHPETKKETYPKFFNFLKDYNYE